MDKNKRVNISSIIFVVVIVLLIIPATRKPIQVALHKGLSYINQSRVINKNERILIKESDFRLMSDQNRYVNFNDVKGKVVFINFWATWCPPCIAEMPSIQSLYSEYKDEVQFLLITSDDLDKIEKFKKEKNFDFEVFHPFNEIPIELATRSIPRTFILNKKGEIVIDESGAINWNSESVRQQINQLLSE